MTIVDMPKDPAIIGSAAQMLADLLPIGWPDLESALEEVAEALEEGKLCRAALDDNGLLLGWIGGMPTGYGNNVWELHPVVVRADQQGQGVGTALVKDLEREVAKRGALTLWLGSDDEEDKTSLSGVDLYPNVLKQLSEIQNCRNHPYEFYQKLGFSIVGVMPDANGFGKPDIYLAKRVRTGGGDE